MRNTKKNLSHDNKSIMCKDHGVGVTIWLIFSLASVEPIGEFASAFFNHLSLSTHIFSRCVRANHLYVEA